MANTSARMLRLLSLLQTHRFWAGPQLAGRLGVSQRTLRRDIDRLRGLGYPVDAQRGVEGGYQLAAGAALPPLVLDDDEAVALAIGLRLAAQGAVSGLEETSVRALAKVMQLMPPSLRRRVDALRQATVAAAWSSAPAIDAGALTTIAQACRDQERLRFSYTASNGDMTARNVEPHRLVSLGRRWYLVAFDLHRAGWRTFRLDRLATVRTTGLRFDPRPLPAADAATFVRLSIGSVPRHYAVEVVVHAPASAIGNLVGQWATVDVIDADCCRLTMTVDNLDWPALALGALRAEFDVVRPPELVALLGEWSARFARATSAGTPD